MYGFPYRFGDSNICLSMICVITDKLSAFESQKGNINANT